jgi:hypothetical protein
MDMAHIRPDIIGELSGKINTVLTHNREVMTRHADTLGTSKLNI